MGSSRSERGRAARPLGRPRRALVALLALAALAGPGALAAQPAAPARPPAPDVLGGEPDEPVGTLPDGTRRVAGRVVTPRDSTLAGVPGVWVTLHRVGNDAAGPVDSVRTGPDGAYALRYRPTGAPDAIYFVAASRGGVAYFSSPLRHAEVRGEEAEVTVFDTTSRPLPLTVRGRHLIVAAPDARGAREVLEVFELTNDSALTAVPPAGVARGVWSTPLPRGVTRVNARESGDVPADGLTVLGGAATLMVPVAPGVKQVAFSYSLPEDALPLQVAVAPGGVLEVLLEEPAAVATGAGLAPVAPVALEGKSFRRFLAQETPAGATVTVTAGAQAGRGAGQVAVPVLIAVLGGGMVLALVLASRRAGARQRAGAPAAPARPASSAPATPQRNAAPGRDALLAQLAALDDAFARRSEPSAEERDAYESERARLKARLADALAGAGAAD